jgi:hypothetical protein
LTVIDFDVACNDALLLRGISHVDWVVHNTENLRRMHPNQVINVESAPRLILIAPRFSPLARSVIRVIARPQITWVKYHTVDVSGQVGLFFERIVDDCM